MDTVDDNRGTGRRVDPDAPAEVNTWPCIKVGCDSVVVVPRSLLETREIEVGDGSLVYVYDGANPSEADITTIYRRRDSQKSPKT